MSRPLSWSAISSFIYDPEQWYKKYVLGEPQHTSAEMEFGSLIGKKLETDPTFLPMIERHNVMEHALEATFNGIPLVGYADSFCTLSNKKLGEYKTGVKKWDQKRVDEHGQLTMYCLMHYLNTKVRPEEMDIKLTWMPTKRVEGGDFNVNISFVELIEENIKVFKTKRTMNDILQFGVMIKKVYGEMQAYALAHE